MFFRLILSCLLLFVFAIHADNHDDIRDRFLSLVFKDEHVSTLQKQMITNAVSRNPNVAQYRDELKAWADEVFAVDSIRNQMSSYFDTSLSQKDMQAVVSFYESETGKRFLACNEGLSRHVQSLMNKRFSANIARLQTSIAQKKRNTLEEIKTPSFDGAKVEDPAGKYRFKFKKEKWSLLKQNLTPNADFSFEHSNGKIMGIILSEGRSIDSDALKEAAKRNLRMGSDRMRVIDEKDINLDSNKGYFLEMNARMRSQELRYFGYVIGGTNGGVQVLCWTYADHADEYREEAMGFLNGLQSFLN